MQIEAFELRVKSIVKEYAEWQHLLPAVKPEHRERFVEVLERAVDIPAAFDFIQLSAQMNDEQFREFLAKNIH